MQNVSYKIEVLENITKVFSQISTKVKSVNALFEKTDKAIKILPNSIEGLNDKLDELKLKQSKAFTETEIIEYRREIEKTETELKKLNVLAGKTSTTSASSFSNMKSSVSSFATGITAAIAVITAVAVGVGVMAKSIFEATAEMETYNAVLTNTFQSSTKASSAMEMITKFAAKTPFQINTLTDAYVKLVNQGFIPTEEQMTSLGDLASSTGKDFGQLAEAILDAQTGEFERLKEFGIKASKSGEDVTFSFKGVETTMKATSAEIQNYILGLGNIVGVSGAMAAISNTLSGKISNLKDTFSQFAVSIGNVFSAGLQTKITSLGTTLETIKPIVISILEKVKELKFDFNISGSAILVNVLKTINDNFFIFKELFNDIKTPIVELFQSLGKLFGSDGNGLANLFKTLAFTTRLALTPLFIVIKVITWISDAIGWVQTKLEELGVIGKIIKGILAVVFLPITTVILMIKGLKYIFDSTTQSATKLTATITSGTGAMEGAFKKLFNLTDSTKANIEGLTDKLKSAQTEALKLFNIESFRAAGEKFAKNPLTGGAEYLQFLNDSKKAMKEITALQNLSNTYAVTTTSTDGSAGIDNSTSAIPDNAGKDIVGNTIGGDRILNISKLVETLNISTTNLQEGTAKIKEEIIKALLAAVNDTYNVV